MSITQKRAASLLKKFGRRRVLVVGDLMLDRFVYGSVSRISPEAPVPVVKVERESSMPGGASNVACNIRALGGRAAVAGRSARTPPASSCAGC
jgi:bifunctional ADP-heptose synthase (sugar kinase/adenylyltransferase)